MTAPPAQTARLIDGKAIAHSLRNQVRGAIDALIASGSRRPGLAVVLVGDNPASEVYVRNKRRSCEEVGVLSVAHDLPADTTEAELLALIARLNEQPSIDGILVQLPLPPQIRGRAVIEAIDPAKDVDGLHPYNLGRLAQREPLLRACTPYGVIKMLQHIDVPLSGMEAVVVGASSIVGRPMALELLLAGATTTVCHTQTRNLEAQVARSGSESRHLVGTTVTLADVCLVPQMYNARRMDCDLEPYPRLRRISAHLESLPAFASAAPSAQPDAV